MLDKEVLKTVSRIELSVRGTLDTVMTGAYHSSFKGNGMEFSEVREYMPGDDVRTIDWNVTARTGSPYVKKFIEEREMTMLLMVDASSSSEFGSGKQMKGEVMATLTALLAFAAIKNNDKVGLLIYTDQVELFIPPEKGRKHVLRLIREILYFKPQHHGTNTQVALEYAGKILNRRAVVVVMSDFLDQGFENAFKILRKRHDVLAVSVVDPRETELPPCRTRRTGRPRNRRNTPHRYRRRHLPGSFRPRGKASGQGHQGTFPAHVHRFCAHRDPRRLQGHRGSAYRAFQTPGQDGENITNKGGGHPP